MNQTDLMQNVLAVDRQAQAMTREAREREENLDASVAEEIQRLREKYTAEAEAYLAELREREQNRLNRALARQDQDLATRMERIETRYLAGRDQWAEQLFRGIVGSEEA